jgi:hypothetical protein
MPQTTNASPATAAPSWGAEFGRQMAREIIRIKQQTDAAIAALEARVAALENRVDELESAGGELRYRGIWQENREYKRGNSTTTNGCLWHCEERTLSRPGTDSTWRLAVKRGTTS